MTKPNFYNLLHILFYALTIKQATEKFLVVVCSITADVMNGTDATEKMAKRLT